MADAEAFSSLPSCKSIVTYLYLTLSPNPPMLFITLLFPIEKVINIAVPKLYNFNTNKSVFEGGNFGINFDYQLIY